MSRPIEEIEADIEANERDWSDAQDQERKAVHRKLSLDMAADELRQELAQAKKEANNEA